MDDENVRKELQLIMAELEELFQLANDDYSMDKSRYSIGLMVGVGYAKRELERVKRILDK
jgi:hypothetical protein